jgi:hypothetical protein
MIRFAPLVNTSGGWKGRNTIKNNIEDPRMPIASDFDETYGKKRTEPPVIASLTG